MQNYRGATAAMALVAAAAAAPAAAELKYENGRGGSVTVYGQVNPGYLSFDDGVGSTSELVDNAHSGSRVGLLLLQDYDAGTFSFNFETSLGLRSSAGFDQTFTPGGADWSRTNLRRIDFAFASNSWGKISAGQGSMASDGIAEADFGGTGLTNYVGVADAAGGFQFRTAAGALSGVTIGDVMPTFDAGRRGRVRYDTPDFNGVTFSVAAGKDILTPDSDDEYYDAALRYSRAFSGFELDAGVGFSRRDRNGVDRDDTFGSLAVKLVSGINFAVAAGSRKDDGDYVYGKVGYDRKFLSIGETSFAVDYYRGNDFNSVGSEATSVGVGINQDIDSINTQLYLGYRTYEFAEVATSYLEADSVLFGARWRF